MKDLIQELLNKTTLECKLRVLNEMFFIDLITKCGYRENKMWENSVEDNLTLGIICDLAHKLADEQLKEIQNSKELC